jgi:hypothetical protein
MRLRLALRDRKGFLEIYERESTRRASCIWMEKLGKVAAHLREGPPNIYAEKIFGIGLSRTGTTSLMVALDVLGFHAAHFVNHFTGEQLTLEDAFLFDAIGDSPVCIMFETLYSLFPNSKFIYTTRPLQSWLESMRTFKDPAKSSRPQPGPDSPHFNPLTFVCGTPEPLVAPQRALVFGSLWGQHPHDLRSARKAFEARVKKFFSVHDRSRLLMFDVFRGDGWEKLCSFVGKQVPDTPFPSENKRVSS